MNFDFLPKYYMLFLDGTKYTILIAVFAVLFGILLGILFSLMRLSKVKVLNCIATVYIEFVRGTPLLVQLYIIYFGLPKLGINFPEIEAFGSSFPDVMAGIIAMSLNSGAYVAEIIRSGIQSVDKGQMEAARSLGMGSSMAMRYVVLPQAIRNILPALGNEFVTIIKDSSITSVIGIHELMYNADTVRGNTFRPFEPLIIAALIYFVLTFTVSSLLHIFERRLSLSDRG